MRFVYLTCFVALGVTAHAQTAVSATRDLVFPPVGLAFTETAQINVANTASNPTNGSAASCTGTISFNNATGASAQTPVKFTVTAGQIFSTELTAAKLGVVNGQRSEFIASVQLTLTPKTPCTLSVSLETFDATSGATHIYLQSPAGGPVTVMYPGGSTTLGRFSDVPRL
jgi:hypothetical protein